MAASVAASVVWLTVAVIITFTPGLFSTTGSALTSTLDVADLAATLVAGLAAILVSDFLVVTGAFNCADTGVAANALAALVVALEPDFRAALVGGVVDLPDGAFPVVTRAGFAGVASVDSSTGGVAVFAVFFIAFAMDQLPIGSGYGARCTQLCGQRIGYHNYALFLFSPCAATVATPDNCSAALNQKPDRIPYDVVFSAQSNHFAQRKISVFLHCIVQRAGICLYRRPISASASRRNCSCFWVSSR